MYVTNTSLNQIDISYTYVIIMSINNEIKYSYYREL